MIKSNPCRNIRLRFCLCCVILWVSSSTFAQQAGDSITGKVHNIPGVTVKARRAPNKITSSVPIQLLHKEEISQLGVQNMADAVRRFAGANVKDYGGIGGLKTVSVRNMGAAHTAVSYDGMPVSNCQAGQIDIGRFSLDNVEMLSLAIGQDDNLLQPARLFASGAVLNIETEKPIFKGTANKTFQVKLNGGSFGYISPAFRWWQKIDKYTQISVNGNYLHADGNYPFQLVNGKYTTAEKRNNSAIGSYQGEGNLYHTFKDNSSVDIKSYYYYSKRGLPGSVILYNPTSNEKLWDENFFTQAHYKKTFSTQLKVQAQAKYNHSWNRYEDKGPEYVDNIYQAIHRQDEYSLSISGLYQPLSNLSIALAQDGYINTLKSNLPDCPFPTRYTSLTAFNARWQWERLSVTGTLVNTYITERVKVGDQPDNLKRLSPSVSANIKPLENEDLYIRLLYKSTFRTPTFNDLYYYRLGNRSLRPEKANEYNLGITWNRRLFPFMDYFSVTIDGYYNNVKDKIVAFPTTYAWRMANYGKVHITGMDLTLASAAKINKNLNLIFSGAYTLQKAIDLTDQDAKNYKDQLPYTPEHSGNVSLIAEIPIINIGYSIVGVSKRYSLSQNIPDNKIDGYLEHTLSLSHHFLLKNYSLQLKAEIINLTDAQYDVIQYYPMPGRSWRISGIFNF